MNNSGSNIDLVFRNGLKDLEVLPPSSVWEGIQPVIAKKQRSFLFLRAAAAAAVIFATAFFIYQYTREASDNIEEQILAFNVSSSPVYYKNSAAGPRSFSDKNEVYASEKRAIFTSEREEDTTADMVENIALPEFKLMPVKNNLNISRNESVNRPFSPFLETPEVNSFSIGQANVISLADFGTIKPAEKWSIAAMASPTYYSAFYSGDEGAGSQLSSSEQAVVSYSGGLSLSYKISKRFSVQSGLYYSSLGQELEGINSFAGFQTYVYSKGDHNFEVLTSSGTVFINNRDVFLTSGGQDQRIITSYNNDVFDPQKASLNPLSNTIQQNFSYLELPVVLRYKLIDKSIDINMTGGLSYNMLVGNSVYTVVDGTKYAFGETKGLNSFMVSSSIGMGMEYSFSTKLSLNLEPTFRYYLNPFSGTSSSTVHPYSFGIFSGLSYKF